VLYRYREKIAMLLFAGELSVLLPRALFDVENLGCDDFSPTSNIINHD